MQIDRYSKRQNFLKLASGFVEREREYCNDEIIERPKKSGMYRTRTHILLNTYTIEHILNTYPIKHILNTYTIKHILNTYPFEHILNAYPIEYILNTYTTLRTLVSAVMNLRVP